jgi:hypothetical protein
MPKKLDREIKRLNMIAPAPLMRRIDDWRRQQPDLPNVSEALRRLAEFALDHHSTVGARKPRRGATHPD